jgi:hypothetical protein
MTRKHLRTMARAGLLPVNPDRFAPRRRPKTAADRLAEEGWSYHCDHPETKVMVFTRDEEVRVPRHQAIRRYIAARGVQMWWGTVILRRYAWVHTDLDIVEAKGNEYFPCPETVRDQL